MGLGNNGSSFADLSLSMGVGVSAPRSGFGSGAGYQDGEANGAILGSGQGSPTGSRQSRRSTHSQLGGHLAVSGLDTDDDDADIDAEEGRPPSPSSCSSDGKEEIAKELVEDIQIDATGTRGGAFPGPGLPFSGIGTGRTCKAQVDERAEGPL